MEVVALELVPLNELNIEDYIWLGKSSKEMGNKHFHHRIGQGRVVKAPLLNWHDKLGYIS